MEVGSDSPLWVFAPTRFSIVDRLYNCTQLGTKPKLEEIMGPLSLWPCWWGPAPEPVRYWKLYDSVSLYPDVFGKKQAGSLYLDASCYDGYTRRPRLPCTHLDSQREPTKSPASLGCMMPWNSEFGHKMQMHQLIYLDLHCWDIFYSGGISMQRSRAQHLMPPGNCWSWWYSKKYSLLWVFTYSAINALSDLAVDATLYL